MTRLAARVLLLTTLVLPLPTYAVTQCGVAGVYTTGGPYPNAAFVGTNQPPVAGQTFTLSAGAIAWFLPTMVELNKSAATVNGYTIDVEVWGYAIGFDPPPPFPCAELPLTLPAGRYTVNVHLVTYYEPTRHVYVGSAVLDVASANTTSESSLVQFSPSCPAPTDAIEVLTMNPSPIVLAPNPLSVTVSGNTIKVVVEGAQSGWTLAPSAAALGRLAPLHAGTYNVQVYIRLRGNHLTPAIPPGTLGPEVLTAEQPLEVFQNPPVCNVTQAELTGSSFVVAQLDKPYSRSLSAKLQDFHGHVVGGEYVWVSRIASPGETLPAALLPDLAVIPDIATSGTDGVVRFSARANSNAGVFQYAMYPRDPTAFTRYKPLTFFIFYNAPDFTSNPTYPVVEYVRWVSGGPHYFMTGSEAEMAKLDVSPGWSRTGAVFLTFPPGSNRPNTTPVCRFYGLPSAGLDSHFYSASPAECESVKERFAGGWQLETMNAFEVYLPHVAGACPYQTQRLYRAFNNRVDANHRYFLSKEVAPHGWTLEGYGADQVAMCLPK